MTILAVVRIRGIRNIDPITGKTLEMIRLNKPNHCVLVPDTPQMLGMLNRASDYIAYGKISETVISDLLASKGKVEGKRLSKVKKEAEIKAMAKELFGGKKSKEFVNPVFRRDSIPSRRSLQGRTSALRPNAISQCSFGR